MGGEREEGREGGMEGGREEERGEERSILTSAVVNIRSSIPGGRLLTARKGNIMYI